MAGKTVFLVGYGAQRSLYRLPIAASIWRMVAVSNPPPAPATRDDAPHEGRGRPRCMSCIQV
jgi:hypothetical protein